MKKIEHQRYEAEATDHYNRPARSCGWVGIICPDEVSAQMIFDKHRELLAEIWSQVEGGAAAAIS